MRQLDLFQDTKQTIEKELAHNKLEHWLDHQKIQMNLDDQTKTWVTDARRKLQLENPFNPYSDVYDKLLNQEGIELNQAIDSYHDFLKFSGLPDSSQFWRKQLQNTDKDSKKLKNHLLQDWKKNLDQQSADWELQRIEELRHLFLEQFLEQMRNLEELKKITDQLGLEPGIFFDYSNGRLTAQDMQQFKRWAEYLSSDDTLKAILDVLGKIQDAHIAQEKIEISQQQTIETFVPDINSREEIVGIRIGRDLEFVLPSELALLSNTETEVLFDLKYIEGNLMCFEMQGLQSTSQNIECISYGSINSKGPMILCIDTSGSMQGTPEFIAKAVALYFASEAMKKKRACFLINFSTSIQTLELTRPQGLNTLIEFLKMSFHGGTDVAPALDFALSLLKKKNYERADLLVVSDFVMATLAQEQHQKIQSAKERGNQFYSLVIGNSPISQFSREYFDREWLFNPRNSSVSEIINLMR